MALALLLCFICDICAFEARDTKFSGNIPTLPPVDGHGDRDDVSECDVGVQVGVQLSGRQMRNEATIECSQLY